MKNIIKKAFGYVKVFVIIAILSLTFYSGMYFNIATTSDSDPATALASSLENAFRDTSEDPIIVILPEPSLYEKTKSFVGFKLPERKTVHLSMSIATKVLADAGIKLQNEPGPITASYYATLKGSKQIFNKFTMTIGSWYSWVANHTWR
jgi:hypothetical protein